MSKKPKHNKNITVEKRARGASKANETINMPVSWHIRNIDWDGSWAFNKITFKEFIDCVYPIIKQFEKMRWNEILGKNHHAVQKGSMIPKARRRLEDIGQDDVDELISFKCSGEKRLWGIRDRNIFKVLWWDPKHEVCPSNKKHT